MFKKTVGVWGVFSNISKCFGWVFYTFWYSLSFRIIPFYLYVYELVCLFVRSHLEISIDQGPMPELKDPKIL